MKFNSAIATTISAVAVSTSLGISASPAFSADFTLGSSSGTWSNVVLDNGNTINPPGGSTVDFLNSNSEVRWGNPASNDGKSGLAFTGVNNLSFNVDEIFKVGTLTHFNNPIFSPVATSADLDIALNFSNPAGLSQAFNFTFGINETPNQPPPACPVGNPPCADIISFPNTLPSESFNFMGMDFVLQLVKFGDTPDGDVTNQFISQEGGTNSTMLYGKITKVNVPEPATLGGLGLLGVYLIARRRTKKG